MMRRLLPVICLLMLAWLPNLAVAAQTVFNIITLQHVFAQDILDAVTPLVGSEGSASAISNQLILRATPERMQQIEQLVETLDVSKRNLRISIRYDQIRSHQGEALGVQGRVNAGNLTIHSAGSPGGDGGQFDLDDQQYSSSESDSQFVTVLEGQRAFILVGQSIPYAQQWLVWTQQYAGMQQAIEFRDINTGFAVRPRDIGDQIELEIMPSIASVNGNGVIDFQQLSTVVRISPGQWFDLSGNMQNKDDVSRNILNQQQSADNRSTRIFIKVD